MTCGEAEKVLEAFVDGELPAAAMRETARHLARCASCEAMAVQLEVLQESVRKAVVDEVAQPDTRAAWNELAPRLEGPQIRWKVLDSLGEMLRVSRFPAPVWIGGTVAAAVIVALLWVGGEEPRSDLLSGTGGKGVQQVAAQSRIDLLNLDAQGNVRVWNQPESGALVIWVDEQAGDVEPIAQ